MTAFPSFVVSLVAVVAILVATACDGLQRPAAVSVGVVERRTVLASLSALAPLATTSPPEPARASSSDACAVCGTYDEENGSLRYVVSLQPGASFMGSRIANVVVKGSGRGRTVLPALAKGDKITIDATGIDGPETLTGVLDPSIGGSGGVAFAKSDRRWVRTTVARED